MHFSLTVPPTPSWWDRTTKLGVVLLLVLVLVLVVLVLVLGMVVLVLVVLVLVLVVPMFVVLVLTDVCCYLSGRTDTTSSPWVE